jgi:PEP-CTERM motif
MTWKSRIVSLVFLIVASGTIHAAIDGSVTISSQDAGGGIFNYTITLNNLPTSTSQIETLWYSWIPGVDFMSASPVSTFAPSGWAANIEHVNGGYYYPDGYSVQYTTTTAPLNPNGSLQFGFSSTVTPTELAGNDSVYGYYPENTTYLYSISVESGDSEQLVAQLVPEPSSLTLLALGMATTLGIARRRPRSRIQ